jgi:hypothetical protein
MAGRAELVDMGVLVMEVLVVEVKAVVPVAVIVVVEITGPFHRGNVLRIQIVCLSFRLLILCFLVPKRLFNINLFGS